MLVAGSQLRHIVDICVENGLTDNFRCTFANTKLSTIVLSPRVQLTKLVDGERVTMATAYFLDQLVL